MIERSDQIQLGPLLPKPSVLERLAVRVSQAVGGSGRVSDQGRVGRLAELEEPTVLLGYAGTELSADARRRKSADSVSDRMCALPRPGKYRFVVG